MRRWSSWAVVAVVATACTVGQEKAVIGKAVDDEGRRREAFEATLRVLDEKPEYVDEFFELARRHPRTLDRFVHDTAQALDDRALARTTARELVAAPPGLHRILVETLDAASSPPARAAIARAISERTRTAAAILAEHPTALEGMTAATVDAVASHPPAQTAFLAAMRTRRAPLARVLASDPPTVAALMGALAAEQGRSLADALRALLAAPDRGASDDGAPPPTRAPPRGRRGKARALAGPGCARVSRRQ